MTFETYALARMLYEAERKLDERNYAKGHSFEEWLRYKKIVTGDTK